MLFAIVTHAMSQAGGAYERLRGVCRKDSSYWCQEHAQHTSPADLPPQCGHALRR